MSDLRQQLESLCVELKAVQTVLKKAGKSRKKTDVAELRKTIRDAASSLEKSLAAVEPERFGRPGIPKTRQWELVATTPCYKCGGKDARLVQWLSPLTGRPLKKFSVICEGCWNVAVRERGIRDAVRENDNFNRTYQK